MKISEKKRERLYAEIYDSALSVGVGIVHEEEIDEKNEADIILTQLSEILSFVR